MGVPWRTAFALQEDGWYLRNDIVWHKPNPMPASMKDRCTTAHEYVFMLSKSQHYFFDATAILEPFADKRMGCDGGVVPSQRNRGGRTDGYTKPSGIDPSANGGRNKRSVWTIPTAPCNWDFCNACKTFYAGTKRSEIVRERYVDGVGVKRVKSVCPKCGRSDVWVDHFAMFPKALVEPCVKAGTSEKGCCATCGAPVIRVQKRRRVSKPMCEGEWEQAAEDRDIPDTPERRGRSRVGLDQKKAEEKTPGYETTGWVPSCQCGDVTTPCVVLDPFFGAGTTGIVCRELGRDFLGIELRQEYADLAMARISEMGGE